MSSLVPINTAPRHITTIYYNQQLKAVKTTHSRWPDMATRNAFYRLTQNQYGASVVEVMDFSTSEAVPHAVITRNIKGDVTCVFKRDSKRPTEGLLT